MLDAWKLALEALLYGPPSPRRTSAAQRVQARAHDLAMIRSVGDLRRHYARLCTTTPYRELRDVPHRDEVLSPRQIADAAFGLRHLEIVSGRHLDVRADRLSRWMLAVAG
jgi:hypothetical protein